MTGRIQFDGAGKTIELGTGDSAIVEGNVEHQATALEDSEVLDVFATLSRRLCTARAGPLRKIPEKTAWIVARYEVFLPSLNLEQGPVLTNLDLGIGFGNGGHPCLPR